MNRPSSNSAFALICNTSCAIAAVLALPFSAWANPVDGSLLRGAQDVSARRDGAEDLHHLLIQNPINIDRVRLALKQGADPNAPDEYGILPLGRAVRQRDLIVAEVLLLAGANPNKRIGDYPDILVVASSDLRMLKLLYRHGADLKARKPRGLTLLAAAAGSGSLEVCRFLVAHGVGVNVNAYGGYTALGAAAGGDHVDVVSFLLRCGADPVRCGSLDPNRDIEAGRPLTVLETAASACSNRVLAYLLKRKGLRFSREAINRALFLSLRLTYLEGYVGTPKRYGMADTVAILVAHGADVNQRDLRGDTPLLYGIRQVGLEESVKALSFLPVYYVLLKAGADVNAQNFTGQTALMIGAAGAEWLYGFLLYHGADPNKRDKMGRTALMYHAKERDEMEQLASDRMGAVRLLLRFGADMSLRDKEGRTAYDIAKLTGSTTVPLDFYDPDRKLPAGSTGRQ